MVVTYPCSLQNSSDSSRNFLILGYVKKYSSIYLLASLIDNEACLDNPKSLIDFIRTLDRELEDEDYLWPEMTVSELLNVHMEFDFLHGRYIGVNQNNDVIFILR